MGTFYTRFMTPLCEIILAGSEDGLSHLHMQTGEGRRVFEINPGWIRDDDFFSDIKGQIEEYLSGNRSKFNVKLDPQGTDFQKRVWSELCRIPCGETRSYKEIAIALGNENASRAVGTANGKNPVPLIIPCHRVIAADGSLAGFAHGTKIKQQLLDIEKGD
ncbi:methylated-DNA--[protein]-cysteine S-methyltransferase [Maridesulfovibrio salexigens]|uniref:Methylated-DNA--protein-cysteine methyltransferase n=1 Tax=Maridesulfovibrio salexigens (strain ATCC 14822 / DSM 2638 / NCIMB 8403 / VKM B-1763) TaxID=526222 RepID=C6BZW2_MARSD|nr:methylated-DNA--[protein]-cysteine S-methyltransferase [Maridesulfovibrio salexigens]ACS79019.1 methylated-DNA/protein-cysteine methyltransferase [Maridesulfovibrio salexigens DSM 2638]